MPARLSAEGATTVATVATDDDADEEVGPGSPPLPPDDRLWRHPSEVRQHGLAGGPLGVSVPTRSPRPATWAIALVAAVAGAMLSTGAMALTGSLSPGVVRRDTVEKVALTPIVSSPVISGDRGVAALAERLSPAVVRLDVTGPDGITTGSGVLFRDDGLVLASAHVLADASAIDARLADGRHVSARLVGTDPLTGVALLDLHGDGFPVAVLGTATSVRIGAPTITIGAPATLDGGPTVTTGMIRALDRRVQGPDGETFHGMLETDASITEETTGGALVDENAALIGIMTTVLDDHGSGFAIPIDLVRRVAEQLLATGTMEHCWLGVDGADVPAEQANLMQIAGGAIVQRVAPSSPAALVGLAPADVITEIDDAPIRSISNLVVQLRSHRPGDRVTVGYWRAGQHIEARVTLAARP